MVTTFYLIRHGETEGGEDQRYSQGKGDDKNSRKQSRIRLADANHLC
jgi:broad specificity phosphatase PhoE